MSLRKARLGSLGDKHDTLEDSLNVPSEVQKEEQKIKSSKKSAPNKLKK